MLLVLQEQALSFIIAIAMVMASETKTIVYRVAAPQQVMRPQETTATIPTPTFVPILFGIKTPTMMAQVAVTVKKRVTNPRVMEVVQAMPATPTAPPRLN